MRPLKQGIAGNELNFGFLHAGDSVLINENDFRNFIVSYETKFNKITNFKRKVTKKTLNVMLNLDEYGIARIGAVEATVFIDQDLMTGEQGKMVIGDYYMTGLFIGADITGYTKDYDCKMKLTFITDNPLWIKEDTVFYDPMGDITSGFDYPFDYPHDYISPLSVSELINPNYVACNFRITMYGAASSPAITINGHEYTVDVELLATEYVTIDSVNKTIVKTATDGTETNEYANRGLDDYIFEKIPVGTNTLSVNGDFNTSITIISERSSPDWT